MIQNKLYKKTTTGKTQEWSIYVEGNTYYTIHGQEGGKLITSAKTTCEGKNIGKTNATTDSEQALAEATAIYKDKIASGYSKDSVNVTKAAFFEPMLAQDYKKVTAKKNNKVTFPMYTQPKLDGVRCIARKEGLFSREGKPIVACPHIYEELKLFFEDYPGLVLDGELYNHTLKDDFNGLISLIRKTKPTDEDLKASKEIVQFHVYDRFSSVDKFSIRSVMIESLFILIRMVNPNSSIIQVPTYLVKSYEEFLTYYDKFLEDGYEGGMLRADTPYENKRTNNLLKYKDFTDEEFELIEILEGKGNRSGMAGKILIRISPDITCEAGIKGGFEFYKQLWKDRASLKGKQVTVQYFNKTPDGKLRFPVAKAIRDYE